MMIPCPKLIVGPLVVVPPVVVPPVVPPVVVPPVEPPVVVPPVVVPPVVVPTVMKGLVVPVVKGLFGVVPVVVCPGATVAVAAVKVRSMVPMQFVPIV